MLPHFTYQFMHHRRL